MTQPTMNDLLAVMEGKKISKGEAVSRIRQVVGNNDRLQSILKQWENEGWNTEDLVDVSDLNRFLKKNGIRKVSGGKSKVSSHVYDLANAIKQRGMEDQVLNAIEKQGIGGKADKAKRFLGGVKKLAFGESIVTEAEVSDDYVRDFFELLVQKYGNPTTKEGLEESIIDDYLDKPFNYSKLTSILTAIDDNNDTGAFNAVKDSILSKWNDSATDTSTLRSISDELTSLSKKGISF